MSYLSLTISERFETLAMISTVSIFGAIFAWLSKIGQANLVFYLNAVCPFVLPSASHLANRP